MFITDMINFKKNSQTRGVTFTGTKIGYALLLSFIELVDQDPETPVFEPPANLDPLDQVEYTMVNEKLQQEVLTEQRKDAEAATMLLLAQVPSFVAGEEDPFAKLSIDFSRDETLLLLKTLNAAALSGKVSKESIGVSQNFLTSSTETGDEEFDAIVKGLNPLEEAETLAEEFTQPEGEVTAEMVEDEFKQLCFYFVATLTTAIM